MPVSASGDIAARSSIAMRISSAQSMSSGAAVTRPSASAASASSALADRGAHRVERRRPRRRSGAARRALAGDHRVERRSSTSPSAIFGARAGVVGQREHVAAVGGEAPARPACRRSTSPARSARTACATTRRAAPKRAAQQADRLAHEPVVACARAAPRRTASTAAASPSVFSSQVPMSSSLVRIDRIASSSSRAIASGHQRAPAASMPAMSVGCGAAGALTVNVAVRRARSISHRRRARSAARRRSIAALRAASAPRPCASAGRSLRVGQLARALLHRVRRTAPA